MGCLRRCRPGRLGCKGRRLDQPSDPVGFMGRTLSVTISPLLASLRISKLGVLQTCSLSRTTFSSGKPGRNPFFIRHVTLMSDSGDEFINALVCLVPGDDCVNEGRTLTRFCRTRYSRTGVQEE